MKQPNQPKGSLAKRAIGRSMRIVCRLRAIMHERQLTAKQLSRLSGVSRETIARLCNNDFTRLRRDIIGKLCTALGITSLDVMFEVYEADIFFPIRLHKEVTFHVGSDSFARKRDAALEGCRMSMGAWDIRAMRQIHEYLNRTVPGISVHVEEHVRYDAAVTEKAKQIFERGNHMIFGSPIANQFAEEVVCKAHGVTPYSPEKRAEFRFVFAWDADRSVSSSFGFQANEREFGIVSTLTGRLVASHTSVTAGHGEDGALIMAYRVWQPPVRRQYGRDDENIVIAVLGYSGIGTYGGALVAIESSRQLYPARTGLPRMTAVSVNYMRPPDSSSPQDNRQVETARLADDDGNDDGN